MRRGVMKSAWPLQKALCRLGNTGTLPATASMYMSASPEVRVRVKVMEDAVPGVARM